MTYDISTLTENQIALLNGIAADQFSDGPTFEGAWYDTVVNQAFEKGIIKTKQQTKATLNQLIRKGVLEVDTTIEEGSSWVNLTAAGGDALSALEDALKVGVETLAGQDVLAGTPEDEVKEALAEIEEEEDEDLLGDIAGVLQEVLDQAEEEEDLLGGVEAATVTTVADTVTTDQVVTHVENYKINEWKDAEDTEWTETIFEDGSRTLKRRREVSGSWRTDYWGAEAGDEKEKATTSKACKIARVAGTFKHV